MTPGGEQAILIRLDGVYRTSPGTGLNPDIAHQARLRSSAPCSAASPGIARGPGSQVADRGGPAASSVSMNGHRCIR
jgi:hypothetical protein